MKTCKRIVSIFLVVLLLVCSAPLASLLGVDNGVVPSMQAYASSAPGSYDYQPMPENYAKAFIGLLYDTSNVTDEMMSAGDIYTFLTGGFEKGSEEELIAKIVFIETAGINLEKCASKYSTMLNNSYDQLLSYLEKKSGGNLAESIVNSTLKKMVRSIAQVVVTFSSDAGDEIWEDVEFISDTYSSISGIPGKIRSVKNDVRALINTFSYAWSSSKTNMYTYLHDYIENKYCEDMLSDIDISGLISDVNAINRYELANSGLYDPILNWASDNHVAVLEYFGDFIFAVGKSVEVQLSSDDPDNVKVMEVHCPTDVYLYGADDELLLSIVSDKVTKAENLDVYALVYNSQKTVIVSSSITYRLEIVGTDDGLMNYTVKEFSNDMQMREVRYTDIPLLDGLKYNAEINTEIYTESRNYNLVQEDGGEIECDYDSLPPVEDSVIDVTVAEELFEGFSTDLIDTVANTMFNFQSSVDVSSYLLTVDDIVALFSAIQKYYPSEYSILSKTDFSYKAIVSPSKGIITSFRFYYDSDVNLSVYQKRVHDLQVEIDKLVAKTAGMNSFEKALYVHDYIVLNCEYDYDLLDMLNNQNGRLDGEIRSERYTEYSVLVNGTGICGSYALAYRAVLNAAGVECLYLSSAEMNHAWNLVKIDGNWYHVDCCWDDPVPDAYGQARRTYFLRTDDEIMQLNHRSWTPGQYKATSTTFSDMPRYDDYRQKYDNGNWYYLNRGKLYSSDISGNNESEISEVTASAIEVADGEIYYAVGRSILHYDTDAQKGNYAYVLPKAKAGDEAEKATIRNFYVDDENLMLYVKGVFNGKNSTTKHTDVLKEAQFGEIVGITISQSELSLNVFDTAQLSAEIVSTGIVPDVDYSWSSSDESIVSIESNGTIKAKNIGEATIAVEGCGFIAECVVCVIGDGLSGSIYHGSWNYNLENKCLTIEGDWALFNYTGYVPTYTAWKSFYKEVEKVIICEGIFDIGDGIFQGFESLQDVVIPSTAVSIGYEAFADCSSLEQIIIPSGVERIGMFAFSDCSMLKKIFISDTVQCIDSYVFKGCYNIEQIIVDEGNNDYSSDETGVLFNKDKTELLLYTSGSAQTNYAVPDGVRSIEWEAFRNCKNLTDVVLPPSLTTIGGYAFADCYKLKSVSLSDGLIEISTSAFNDCLSLEELKLPSTLKYLEGYVLTGTSVSEIYIPASLTSINPSAFWRCNTIIQFDVDYDNPNYISDEHGVLYDKDKTILYAYPSRSQNTKYEVESSTVEINSYAFYDADSLVEITLNNGLKKIGGDAFNDCSQLKSVNLPLTVSEVGTGVFSNCQKLNRIDVDPENNDYVSDRNGVLYTKDYSLLVQYPAGNTLLTYKLSDYTTKISYCAFQGNTFLTGIELSPILETIAPYAFWNCTALKDIVIPQSVTDLGRYVFLRCTSLESIVVPENVAELWCPFEECSNLKKVLILGSGFESYTAEEFTPASPVYYIHYDTSVSRFYLKYGCTTVNIDEIKENHVHDYFLTDYYAKTSNTDGLKVYSCYCGESCYEEIDHNYSEPMCTATCTESGIIKQVCSVCGYEDIIEEAPPLGHNWQEIFHTEGNCQAPTEITYQCTRCPETKVETVDANLEHDYVETVIQPNCTSYGYTQAVCSVCGEEIATDFKSPLGHKLTLSRTTENCIAHGSYVYACNRCDYREDIAIDAGELQTETVTTPATCTLAGSEKQVCKLCGATVSSRTLPANGHQFDENFTVDVKPTCTAGGSKSRHCQNCEVKIFTESIPASGHAYGSWTKLDDNQHQRVCANDPSHIEKADHSWNAGEVTKVATCKETGTCTYTCAVCNATKAETINKNTANHASYGTSLKGKTDATCTSKGYTGDTVCNGCGTVITKGSETEALGHTNPNSKGDCERCGTHLKDVDSSNSQPKGDCPYCGGTHTGIFGWLIKLIHSILALFGLRK